MHMVWSYGTVVELKKGRLVRPFAKCVNNARMAASVVFERPTLSRLVNGAELSDFEQREARDEGVRLVMAP